MLRLDSFIINRSAQPFANYLSSKGINCGYFGFNIYFSFISTLFILDFLLYIINSHIPNQSTNIFSNGSLFFIPFYIVKVAVYYIIFCANFIKTGKKIDALSDDSSDVVSIDLLKGGSFIGAMWRLNAIIEYIICIVSTYSLTYTQNFHMGLLCILFYHINSIIYIFMILFSGCYFRNPTPPDKKM